MFIGIKLIVNTTFGAKPAVYAGIHMGYQFASYFTLKDFKPFLNFFFCEFLHVLLFEGFGGPDSSPAIKET